MREFERRFSDRRQGEGESYLNWPYRSPGYAESLEAYREKTKYLLGETRRTPTTATKGVRKGRAAREV